MQLFPVALLALASVAVAQLQNIHLEGQPLLEAFASRRPGALVDLYLLAGVLAPADCSGNGVVAIQANVTIGNIVDICLCVDVLTNLDPSKVACAACPANSHPICTSDAGAACGCDCDAGFTKDADGDCVAPVGPSQRGRRSRSVADIRAAAAIF